MGRESERMPEAMKRGDRVSWSSGRTRARGTIERVITTRAKVGGRTVAGSKTDPRYLVRDERSGATAVRKGAGLRRLRPAAAKPPRPAAARRPRPAAAGPARPTAARPAGPAARRRGPDWRVIGGVAFGALVAAIVGIYFTQAPDRIADGYRDDAGPAFERVDESMYEVFESFRADYFRGLAIEELTRKRVAQDLGRLRAAFRKQYRSDRETVERGGDAIDAAEDAISEAEAELTEVATPPLLGGVGDLAGAREDADDAERYLADAREFLPRYRELLDYAKRIVTIEESVTAAILDNAPAPQAGLDTYRAALARTVEQLQRAERRFEALDSPPESGEAFEFATGEGLELSLDYYRQVREAFDEVNLGLFDSANDELDRKVRRFGIGIITRFSELQDDSELSGAIDEIEASEDDLADELGADAGPESVAPPLIPPDDSGEKSQA